MKVTLSSNSSGVINNTTSNKYYIGITPYIFTLYDSSWKQMYCEKIKKWNKNGNDLFMETVSSNPLTRMNHTNFEVNGNMIEKKDEIIFIFDNAMKITIKNI